MTFSSGDKICIVGDSLTASPYRWAHYLLASIICKYPSLNLSPISYGAGGRTVQNYLFDANHPDAEFHKYIRPLTPDKVITFLGTNGNDPPDANTASFAAGYSDYLTNYVAANGVAGNNALSMGPWPQSTDSGSTTMQSRSASVASISSGLGMHGMDTWSLLSSIWTNPAYRTALQYPGTQGTPQTHAGTAGHILLTKYVMEFLSISGATSSAVINGTSLASQTGCTVTGITANAYSGIDFSQTLTSYPWITDEDGWDNAISIMPEVATWQNQTLAVTGLTSGTYDVLANGELITTASSTAIAAGINLANIKTGPHYRQRRAILDAIRDKQGIDRVSLSFKSPNAGMRAFTSNASVKWAAGYRDSALVDQLATQITALDSIDSAIWAAAAPTAVTLSFRLQGSAPSAAATRTRPFRRAGFQPC